MSNIIYLSQDGYDNLRTELDRLKNKERPSIINQISEARDKGDLSENAEYDAAKEAQGLLEARIAKLENDISNARVMQSNDSDYKTVRLLTAVTIKNLNNDIDMKYVIVSQAEADLSQKKISADSPIGKGLIGKAVGEIAKIKVPSGTINFKIIKIEKY